MRSGTGSRGCWGSTYHCLPSLRHLEALCSHSTAALKLDVEESAIRLCTF